MSTTRPTRVCVFCGDALTAANRSREHVIRRIWLEELELEGFQVHQIPSTGAVFRPVRTIHANALLAGSICAPCNNGWMNRLDAEVHDVVMGLAKSQLAPADIPDCSRWPLARWALKCACALESTTFFRHIPEEVRRGVMRDDWRPDSMVLFAAYFGDRAAAPGLPGIWPSGDAVGDYLAGQPQSKRLKCCFSIGDVVIVGGYLLDVTRVAFAADLRFLTPIISYECDVMHRDAPPDLFEQIPSPEGLIPGPGVVAAAMFHPAVIALKDGTII